MMDKTRVLYLQWAFSGVSTAHAQQQQTGVRHFWWRGASGSGLLEAAVVARFHVLRHASTLFRCWLQQRQQALSRFKLLWVSLC
uniref:Putative secreted protein n=1 Tax=Ixodes ricinus TaxID=34613 RepID=A0A6B0U8I5_IXORI